MKKLANKILVLLLVMVMFAITVVTANAEIIGYVMTNKNGVNYYFDLGDLYDSYDWYMTNQNSLEAELFKNYKSLSTPFSYYDSKRGFIDYNKLVDAYEINFDKPGFNITKYIEEEAERLAETVDVIKIEVNENGEVVEGESIQIGDAV